MGFWNLYFAAKIFLFAVGRVTPVWWLNVLFVLALIVPLRQRWQRVLRQVLAVAAGATLLYHESMLPPITRVISQLPGLSEFSPSYMLELARRIVTPAMLWVPLVVVAGYLVLNRYVRVTSFVLLALLVIPLWQGAGSLLAGVASAPALQNATSPDTAAQAGGGAGDSYDAQLAAFYAGEKSKHVTFTPASSDPSAQFDIIVVHICSLAWDDMDVVNMRENGLFSRLDYIFTNFSSAASYSGPAAIRVLRASCGQESHQNLYNADPADCHLFADLARDGYDVQALLNHDGRFDDFRGIVQREIGVPGVQIQSNDGLTPFMRAFDGSPLYDDYDAIAKWYQARIAKGGGPVALYYNTVSMHDGNRLPNSNMGSLESYPIRLKRLLDDVDKLEELVQKSGRKAAIVFVPEHGAALRGDANQISGMREIPTPRIVHIPVGVKLVGLPAGEATGRPISIDTPTSFIALAQLLANLVGNSPYQAGAPPLAQYAADLPQTRMVGENESTVTMTTANGYVTHTPEGVWVEGH